MLPLTRRLRDAILRLRAVEALRHREYRLLWYGQAFGSMGMWMDEVTRGWLIYELTDSAVQLGLVRGVQAIPFLLLSPVAGSAADRYSRRAQLVVSLGLNVLIYAATALLIFTGQIRPWHLYVMAMLMGAVQVFQQPARAAMISDAVPPGYLINAIGLNALVFNVSRSVGPALGGALIVLSGTGGAYCVQALFLFVATVLAVRLRPAERAASGAAGHGAHRESFAQSIVEGWKFSWASLEVRTGLLCVAVVCFFIVPFTTLLPVFARDLLEIGAQGQGLLLTAMGIGALCSAVLIASAGENLPRGWIMLGSGALYGIVVALFAASPWFGLSLLLMAAAGLAQPLSNALVQTVIQSYSPSEFRGRTLALFSMHHVSITAGSMLIGALSLLLGPRWAMASMGAAGSLVMMAILMAMPRARQIR
jgi:MFS family permease